MDLVTGTSYRFKVTRHAKVGLAFRYGVLCNADEFDGYFEGVRKINDDGSRKVKINYDGQLISAVLSPDCVVVTVLAKKKELTSQAAQGVKTSLEVLHFNSPENYPLETIVKWREEFLTAKGALTPAKFRQAIAQSPKAVKVAEKLSVKQQSATAAMPKGLNENSPAWISCDELHYLGVPEDQWVHILAVDSLQQLAGGNVPQKFIEAIDTYRANTATSDIEKLYSLEFDDDTANYAAKKLASFLVELDPEQKQVLARLKSDGPYLIKGGAGTGKSLVGLYHIRDMLLARVGESLFDQDEAQYGVITYTNTLVAANQALLSIGLPATAKDSVTHSTLDKIAYDLAVHHLGGNKRLSCLNEHGMRNWLCQFVLEHLSPIHCQYIEKIGLDYVANEIEETVYGNALTNLDDYLGHDRRGRKRPLRVEERQAIWAAYEELQIILKQKDTLTFGLIRCLALSELNSNAAWPRFTGLFVDEAQDMSKVSRLLCLGLVKDPKHLIFAADTAQSIYTVPPSWTRTSDLFNFKKRKPLTLAKSYRSTKEISTAIAAMRLDPGDEDDISDMPAHTRSGPKPKWIDAPQIDHCNVVAESISQLINSAANPINAGQVAVIVRDNMRLSGYESAFAKRKIPAVSVTKKSPISLDGSKVHIITAHSAKGLSFPFVFVPDLNDQTYPSSKVLNKAADEQQREQLLASEQRLLYVALSRCSASLYIISDVDEPSRFLTKLLRKAHWE